MVDQSHFMKLNLRNLMLKLFRCTNLTLHFHPFDERTVPVNTYKFSMIYQTLPSPTPIPRFLAIVTILSEIIKRKDHGKTWTKRKLGKKKKSKNKKPHIHLFPQMRNSLAEQLVMVALFAMTAPEPAPKYKKWSLPTTIANQYL